MMALCQRVLKMKELLAIRRFMSESMFNGKRNMMNYGTYRGVKLLE